MSNKSIYGVGANSSLDNILSIPNFAAETMRKKVGYNVVVDAHVMRILHNKYLGAFHDAESAINDLTGKSWLSDGKELNRYGSGIGKVVP
ncbi:hypothetical protein Tco_0308922 [Tanacetum coccineum]